MNHATRSYPWGSLSTERAFPLRGEELAEQLTASARGNSGVDLWVVERGAISQQIPDRTGGSGLLIEGPIDDSRNPRPDHSPCTHCTGLEGDDKGGIVEAPPSGHLGGIAHGHELGVPEWILIDFATIVTAPDHRSVAVDDNGTDGNVVMLAGQGRLGEGECHPLLKLQVPAEAELRALLRRSLLR